MKLLSASIFLYFLFNYSYAVIVQKSSPLTKRSEVAPSAIERSEYVDNFEYVSYSSIKVHPTSQKLYKRALSTRVGEQDSFILQMYGYNTTFCIHLHPTPYLIHEKLRKKLKLPAFPYSGYVVAAKKDSMTNIVGDEGEEYWQEEYVCDWTDGIEPEHESYAKHQDNWARITVHNNGDKRFKSFDFRPSMDLFKQQRGLSFAAIDAEDIPLYEGSFVYNNELYLIKPAESLRNNEINMGKQVLTRKERHPHHYHADLVLFKYTDIKVKYNDGDKESLVHDHGFCGMDTKEWNKEGAEQYYEGLLKQMESKVGPGFPGDPMVHLGKRSVKDGCPTLKKVLYTVAVADCTYIDMAKGSDEAEVKIIDAWNSVSGIFERTFNIYIGLLDVKLLTPCFGVDGADASAAFNKECSSSYEIGDRLSDFSKWRGEQQSDAGLYHLLSNCPTGPTVGLAWLNMVCTTDAFSQNNKKGGLDWVSGTGISTGSNAIFMTIAHEIGHNFGANHDCTNDNCQVCGFSSTCSGCCPCLNCDCQNSFIMNPTNNVPTDNPKFSDCSQVAICTKNQLSARCLAEPGSKAVINGFQCGNGIKEGSEQCDCGKDCATDPCCSSNCTLKAQAVCSDSNDACCRNCQIIPVSEKVMCRNATGVCDIPEYCQGNATCPTDIFKEDGLNCGNGTDSLKCASGVCTSRSEQCKARTPRIDVLGECALYSGQCAMFCETSEQGCVKVSSAFYLDGTPCGKGGVCQNKKCTNPDLLGTIYEWITENQNISIAIIIVLAILFFVLGNKCLKNVKAEKDSALLAQARLEESELSRFAEIDRQQKMRQKQIRDQQKQAQQQQQRRTSTNPQRARGKSVSEQAKQTNIQKTMVVKEDVDDDDDDTHRSSRTTSVSGKDKRVTYSLAPDQQQMSKSMAKSAGQKSFLQDAIELDSPEPPSSRKRGASVSKSTNGGAKSFDPRSPLSIDEEEF